MRFHILDVDHGFCAYLAADNNHLILFDCGHSTDPVFRPSGYLYDLGYRSVQRFFVTSFDQDHIGDLPSLRRLLGVDILTCNTSITPEQLRRVKLKGGPITPEMEELFSLMGRSDSPATHHPEFPPRVSWQTFHARYGRDFDDTNNLSVVTFLNCDGTIFLLPGNLEEAGWRFHLRNEAFKGQLRQVNVFIASHQGRETGYCRDVFDYCNPNVIVFSDSATVQATRETAENYAAHAIGFHYNGQTRYALSTRNDGNLWWDL